MATVYFAGGEDHDHYSVAGSCSVSTFSGSYRTAFARGSLLINNAVGGPYWSNYIPYAGTPTSFWFSARYYAQAVNTSTNAVLLQFLDAASIRRLWLFLPSIPNITVQKLNTAGGATTLANTLGTWSFAPSVGIPDKIDVNWVNAVSGSLDIWYNGVHVFNFVGDTTTETTAIAYHRLGYQGASFQQAWSEIIVCDTDTRSMSLETLAPVANGNTHNFDTGSPAASNVNELVLNDATLDGSTVAGQIDQYTIPGIASGTYAIFAVGVSARMQKGTASSPSKMDLGVRSTSDYWSSDQVLTMTWANYQNWWVQDPNTSASWLALPSNIGLKSVT